jgi:hypothetical protein
LPGSDGCGKNNAVGAGHAREQEIASLGDFLVPEPLISKNLVFNNLPLWNQKKRLNGAFLFAGMARSHSTITPTTGFFILPWI